MTDSLKQISFYLAKDRYKSFDELLKKNVTDNYAKGKEVKIKYDKDIEFDIEKVKCRFIFCKTSNPRKVPKWVSFINTKLKEEDRIKTNEYGYSQTTKSVLLLKTDSKIVVATFGFGDSLIEKSRFCPDFGIKTAMNLCGNERVKQASMTQHKDEVQHVSRQSSKFSSFSDFDMNETDFLNYISAQMEENLFLQGRDKITLQTKGEEEISWKNIIAYVNKFIKAYYKDDYKTLFPNYANFNQIVDIDVITNLDNILLGLIKSKQVDKIQLCVPEFINDDEFWFVYRNNDLEVPFIQINDFYDPSRKVFNCDLKDLDIRILKNTKVYPVNVAEDKVLMYKFWKVYDCIIADVDFDDNRYILSSGIWRKAEKDFVNNIFNNLPNVENVRDDFKYVNISDNTNCTNRESIYNEFIGNTVKDIIVFDKSKSKITNGKKLYEFCDLLDVSGNKFDIIQVKQKAGSSRISYLFTQAKFYGEAFLFDETFLKEIKNNISNNSNIKTTLKNKALAYIPDTINENRGDMYNIRLFILYDKNKPEPALKDLPLLALYELSQTYIMLKTKLKYNDVSISFIPVDMLPQTIKIKKLKKVKNKP